MAFCRSRRNVVSLLFAMLFSISAVAQGFVMTEAALKMSAATAAMETPSSNHEMDCGGDDNAARAACVAICAGSVAILCEPAMLPIVAVMQDLTAEVEIPLPGRGIPPEPHPPKTAVLS